MGRYSAEPRYNLVSVRISDQELAELEALKGDRMTTSNILRRALRLYIRSALAKQLNSEVQGA